MTLMQKDYEAIMGKLAEIYETIEDLRDEVDGDDNWYFASNALDTVQEIQNILACAKSKP